MSDDMRGLFFIVKGNYVKGVGESFTNKATGDVNYIGGYDPYEEDTKEWYLLLDRHSFNCVASGGSLEKVLESVYKTVKKFKGVAKKYHKWVSESTSNDYYETHYLGHPPLTPEAKTKKAQGKRYGVSEPMKYLYEEVFKHFGDFFEEEIEEEVERAYKDLREEKPLNKSKRLVSKNKKNGVEFNSAGERTETDTTQVKKIKPKVTLGIKKLKTV